MPRTLSTYALASLDEMKKACGVNLDTVLTDGDNFLENLYDSLEFASDEVERYLQRHLVTRGSLTEYHSASPSDPSVLFLRQFPIISPTAPVVVEGYWSAGAYVVSTTLTVGTDYVAHGEEGKLIRLSGGAPTSWAIGYEGVRVVYAGGYATTAVVPDHLQRVCLSLASRRFAEVNGGVGGVQSKTDGLGTVTRFLPAELLKMEQDALRSERRYYTTGRAA